MPNSNRISLFVSLALSLLLSAGSLAYAASSAPAIIGVQVTYEGERPEPETRHALAGGGPDYQALVHFHEVQEASLIVEDTSARTPLFLSIPGARPASWATAIELREHDGPLSQQLVLIQPVPRDTDEAFASGYRVRWEREARALAALRGLVWTPIGLVLLVSLGLVALRIAAILWSPFEMLGL